VDAHAKALRPTFERTVALAKKYVLTEKNIYFRMMHKYLTTRFAIEKLYREILPRLGDINSNFS
jgi:ribosomal protein L17